MTEAARDLQQLEHDKPNPTLLELAGKVLDQLSLSAWLPATMLVGSISLLAQLHTGDRFDIGGALSRLARQPFGILLVIAFALVLTTMITQAFAFEFIRLFEGYWGGGPAVSILASTRIRSHLKRKKRLEDLASRSQARAFIVARRRMISDHVDTDLIDILELEARTAKESEFAAYSASRRAEALSMGWFASAPPDLMQRREAIHRRLRMYPSDHRLLPTILGNTLRAHEDRMRIADGGDLEGFVIRNYDRMPPILLLRHHQARTRLDMYCTLIVVFVGLSMFAVWALWKFEPGHLPAAGAAGTFLALGILSYAGAVSSARGYGAVLLAIDSHVTVELSKTKP